MLEPHAFGSGLAETKELPAGSFVKPIERRYLPAHVLADPRWRLMVDNDDFVFCYTNFGIVPILRTKVKMEW